nr:spidroin-2 isoform X2 [Helicoverpa armigera]
MYKTVLFLIFAATVASSDGVQPTNYEISRNQLGGGGGNYGNYYPPGHYGPGQYGPGQYGPGQYGPGHYGPGMYAPPGPPGAHPGCPLCDSSVYSYCSHKQAHDACCCSSVFNPYNCGKTDCKFLYANSCEEHQLITNCCCVDLYKSNVQDVVPVVPVA